MAGLADLSDAELDQLAQSKTANVPEAAPLQRSLGDYSDAELTEAAKAAPSIQDLSHEQLAALSVHHGMMQPAEAQQWVEETKAAERQPLADALAGAIAPAAGLPEPVARVLLSRGGRVGDVAAQVLTPVAGSIAGTEFGGLPGLVAGGAAGGSAGDALAQARQYLRGARDQFSPGENVTATLLGGVPLPKLALPAGAPVAQQIARAVGKRAVQGAGLGAGAEAAGELIDQGKVNFGTLAQTGLLGALFGAGAGAVEFAAQRALTLRAIRQTPEFRKFKGTDAELVDAVRDRMAKETPPPPEPVNVTGTAPENPAGEVPGTPTAETPGGPAAPMPEPAPATPPRPESVPPAPEGKPPGTIPPPAAPEPAEAISELSDSELQAAADQAKNAAVDRYRELPEARGGRYISADLARPLIQGYDPQHPLAAVKWHPPAQEVVDQLWRQGLEDPNVKRVTFLAGGAGSGKSTIERIGGNRDPDTLVFDGVFGSGRSYSRVNEALAAGKSVDLTYVYRDPVDAMNGVVGRRAGQPIVPAELALRGHFDSRERFLAAAREYADDPRVRIRLFDNSGGPGEAKQVADPVAFMEKVVRDSPSYDEQFAKASELPAVAALNPVDREVFLQGRSPGESSPAERPEQGSAPGARQVDSGGRAPVPEGAGGTDLPVAEGPSGAKPLVSEGAGGPVVEPTAAEDRRVSQLADRPALRAQREFLEKALRDAAKNATPEGGGKVRIEVPGDGTFVVPNEAASLNGLADRVKRAFGKGLQQAGPGLPRTSARALPKIGSKVAPAAATQILARFTDESKYAEVIQDGPWAVATTGKILIGSLDAKGVSLDAFTKAVGKPFPKWRDALRTNGQGLRVGDATGKPSITLGKGKSYTVDTGELIKKLNSAVASLGEKDFSVTVHPTAGDSLGISHRTSGDGADYRSADVTPGQRTGSSVDGPTLRDVLEGLRRLGNERIEVMLPTASAEDSTGFVLKGERAFALVMPFKETQSAPVFEGERAPKAAKPAPEKPAEGGSGNGVSAGRMATAGRTTPPVERMPPADDPRFSQLPMQLPEMVQLYKILSQGKVPKVRERLRVLGGSALGVFHARVGDMKTVEIQIRADLFQLVSGEEKLKLLDDAVAWATAMKQAEPGLDFKEAIRERFEQLVTEAEQRALREDPKRAMDTLAHEIGHFVDFIPNATLRRGNILGRIAALNSYFKGFIAEIPGAFGGVPTDAERAALRRRAERELEAQVREIVEEITREVPVFRDIPITADDVTSILKGAQRDEFPQLYDWFVGLDRATKAAVLRAAMKGIVDERAAKFGRREQIGTQTVTEKVTRREGPPVDREAIRRRYDELLRQELRARGLISELEVRRELMEAMKWWQGVNEVPKYFHTSTEMWAEAYSMFLNNPAGLAKRAPTFYRALRTYMLRRPQVKDAYALLQEAIKSGAIQHERVENLRDAWIDDEFAGLRREVTMAKIDWRKVRDTFRLLFTNQHAPIEGRALKKLDTPEGQRVLAALKNYSYRAAAHEAIARAINQHVEAPLAEANLHHNDLAEFMLHQRIANGDRQGLANPQGWSPNTSRERLEEMQRDLGAIRYGALETAQRQLREIYEQHVLARVAQAKVVDPKLMEVLTERTLYAPFAKDRNFNPHELSTIEGLIQQRYGRDVSARIYRQIGTLGDIRSPYVALVQKALALVDLAYTQMAVKAVRDFLQAHESGLIMEAHRRFTGRRWEPRIVDNGKVGTLLTLDEGKVTGYYVPREIYEVMQRGSPLEMMIVGLAHRALAWPKALLTDLNPGFWAVNFFKDAVTLALQLPSGLSALRQLPTGYLAAKATFTGAENQLADRALKDLYVISRADPRGEHLGHPDELTRMLLRMGQDPRLFDAEVEKIGRIHRLFMWYKQQGQILERTVKLTGLAHLDGPEFSTMPEWQRQRAVRELAGSPDFLTRGRAISVPELFGGPIFMNAWLQGIKSFTRAARQNPRQFWPKFLAFFGLPALAFYAFEKGYFNAGLDDASAEDYRDQLRSIPERDKVRGFIFPLGWVDRRQGKVAYLVAPFPDQARFLYAGLRKVLQTAEGEGGKQVGLGSVVQYGGQDLPGTNPMIAEGVKWWQFAVLGQNPYDDFRGGNVLPDDVMKSGQGAAELAKQSASNLTGGIVYKHRNAPPGDTPTEVEKFLQLPIVSNVLGRWVRVSNAGLREETDRTLAPIQQREAQLRLVGQEMTRKSLNGLPWTPAETTLTQNEPYLVGYLIDHQKRIMSEATSNELALFDRATSPAQKAALLQAWSKRAEERAKRLSDATP